MIRLITASKNANQFLTVVLRSDEAAWPEHRDVAIVWDQGTQELILEMEVRGKRGIGHCKSMTGAVRPFSQFRKRNISEPTDLLFPRNHRQHFNAILDELSLKTDR